MASRIQKRLLEFHSQELSALLKLCNTIGAHRLSLAAGVALPLGITIGMEQAGPTKEERDGNLHSMPAVQTQGHAFCESGSLSSFQRIIAQAGSALLVEHSSACPAALSFLAAP